MNFVLPANAANNDDMDAGNDDGDIDGDNEEQVETLVAHLWNLSCPLHTAPGSPHEHQLRTQQCFRFRRQVQAHQHIRCTFTSIEWDELLNANHVDQVPRVDRSR